MMYIANSNCKKIISFFTLTLYVCFLVTAVLHTHVYDFKSATVVTDNNGSSNKIKDPFLDDQSNCRLVQFLHSYYSTPSIPINDLTILPFVKNIKVFSSIEYYDHQLINPHFLRAPPSINYSA